jgi:putative phosphoesterase
MLDEHSGKVEAMRIAVLADTHIPKRARGLPQSAWELIRSCDAVLHAGDVVTQSLIDDLAAVRPVHVVRGNNDALLPASTPERLEVTMSGTRIGMIHDSGSVKGRRERVRRWFPRCRVVVFGHSHIPYLEDDGELLLLNPGSPTDRRRMPTFTMALLTLSDGQPSAELIDLGLARAA